MEKARLLGIIRNMCPPKAHRMLIQLWHLWSIWYAYRSVCGMHTLVATTQMDAKKKGIIRNMGVVRLTSPITSIPPLLQTPLYKQCNLQCKKNVADLFASPFLRLALSSETKWRSSEAQYHGAVSLVSHGIFESRFRMLSPDIYYLTTSVLDLKYCGHGCGLQTETSRSQLYCWLFLQDRTWPDPIETCFRLPISKQIPCGAVKARHLAPCSMLV